MRSEKNPVCAAKTTFEASRKRITLEGAARRLGLGQLGAHDRQQGFGGDRLGDRADHIRVALLQLLAVAVAGHDDHRDVRGGRVIQQPVDDRLAIHVGQRLIQQDQVRLRDQKTVEPFRPALGQEDIHIAEFLGQSAFRGPGRSEAVINDQNFLGHAG